MPCTFARNDLAVIVSSSGTTFTASVTVTETANKYFNPGSTCTWTSAAPNYLYCVHTATVIQAAASFSFDIASVIHPPWYHAGGPFCQKLLSL